MNYKFEPGRVLATPAALSLLQVHSTSAAALLHRHLSADWGQVCADDAALNDEAVHTGARVLSSFAIGAKAIVWIITDAVSEVDAQGQLLDPPRRLCTTILLPSEY